MTWAYQTKAANYITEIDFLFSDGSDYLFSDSTDFVFREYDADIYDYASKNTATYSYQTKNTASYSYATKN